MEHYRKCKFVGYDCDFRLEAYFPVFVWAGGTLILAQDKTLAKLEFAVAK